MLADAGFMYFTFTGNDAACAASVAVLDIMEREGLVERAAKMGAVLGDRLHAELDGHPAVVEVRGRGMFYGIELRIPHPAVVAEALSRDVWMYPAGVRPGAERRDGRPAVRHHRRRARPGGHHPSSCRSTP